MKPIRAMFRARRSRFLDGHPFVSSQLITIHRRLRKLLGGRKEGGRRPAVAPVNGWGTIGWFQSFGFLFQ